MKKVLIPSFLVVALVAMAAAWSVAAPTAKPERVAIAHLEEVVDPFVNEAGELGTLCKFHVIEVSERSLDGHLGHGDIYPTEEPVGARFEVFKPIGEE